MKSIHITHFEDAVRFPFSSRKSADLQGNPVLRDNSHANRENRSSAFQMGKECSSGCTVQCKLSLRANIL